LRGYYDSEYAFNAFKPSLDRNKEQKKRELRTLKRSYKRVKQ